MDAVAMERLYGGVRGRIAALVDDHRTALDSRLPACPAWSGRQLLCHLVGVPSDLVNGEVDGYASPAWTARHLDSLADVPVDEVVDRWHAASDRLRDASPVMGTPALDLAFGDAVVHEADLAEAIAPAHRVPLEAVGVAIQSGIARWRAVLGAAGLPSLRIDVPGLRSWWLGPDEPGAVGLDVDGYELFRLLYGRRSREQVAGLGWSSDPTGYLDAGLAFPFAWSERPLEE